MANKSRAFRKGFVLGGLVGAGILIWNAPRSGRQTREQVLETFEVLLFKLLDIPTKFVAERDGGDDVLIRTPPPAQASPAPELPVDIVLDGPRSAELSV